MKQTEGYFYLAQKLIKNTKNHKFQKKTNWSHSAQGSQTSSAAI